MQNEYVLASAYLARAYSTIILTHDKSSAYADVAQAAALLGVQQKIEDLFQMILSKIALNDLMTFISKVKMAEPPPVVPVIA